MVKLEYIWLDGYQPEANLRSKTKVITDDFNGLEDCPQWSFDGSSTKQAEGKSSDCILNPVRIIMDIERTNQGGIPSYLVMCEVLNPDGTPHLTNKRNQIKDNDDYWFGFEQEYTLTFNERPLGFPERGYPSPQGMYYCSVGIDNVAGRDIVEEHFNICLKSGLNITGINAEVMLGQWEYQILGKGTKQAGDDLWLSRYLLFRITEKYGVKVEFHPKPVKGDWNGSGLHVNFSNKRLREEGGEDYVNEICETLRKNHKDHIAVYGSSNEQRLTGLHETQHIDMFSYGVSDRGASIRIPISMSQNNWKGYLEDRRPASNADPYQIVNKLVNTVESVKVMEVA
jgi:glutamine synthetase